MRELKWNPSYSVNIKKIDDQHQIIIGILNRISQCFEPNSSPDNLVNLVDELTNYAQIHFSYEEQLLEKYKYHGLEDQIAEHRMYERKVEDIRVRLAASEDKAKPELIAFVADWWMGHIQGLDQDYSRYMNNCGVY
jgi:hemerythrin